MSARSQVAQLVAKGAVIIGALFVVSVVLAAIPSHHAPVVPVSSDALKAPLEGPGQADHRTAGTDDEAVQANEHAAVSDMTPGARHDHGDLSAHMYMTTMRKQTPEDRQRANEIVEQLRAGIEKYKDYHVALNEGYRIFLPNIPQPEYHFTSYKNGFLEAFTFDAARPTSLLYKKTASGFELVGAMYTMPKTATEDQLDRRVPLGVAMWHLHTNLCMPGKDQMRAADWSKFGLKGSITTEEACDAAGGKFRPVIFGWMVHVYPYEDSLDKIFAMRHDERR